MSADFSELPNYQQEIILRQIEKEFGEEYDPANYSMYVRAQELADQSCYPYFTE